LPSRTASSEGVRDGSWIRTVPLTLQQWHPADLSANGSDRPDERGTAGPENAFVLPSPGRTVVGAARAGARRADGNDLSERVGRAVEPGEPASLDCRM